VAYAWDLDEDGNYGARDGEPEACVPRGSRTRTATRKRPGSANVRRTWLALGPSGSPSRAP